MIRDELNRPATDLRISVTDRCNFRCAYCMPPGTYQWIDRREILTFEEIARLARILAGQGIRKIRLTGGEPLLRRNLDRLIAALSALDGVQELCLTTNGVLLAEQGSALVAAGLRRVNVSLDTLDAEKFRRITRQDHLPRILDGLFAAKALGLLPIKINTVVVRGVNDDEIVPLAGFARRHGFSIRFIEYMDVGTVNHWHLAKMVPKEEILGAIRSAFALEGGSRDDPSSPSVTYRFADGNGDVGVIASVTEPFCGDCTRLRLTADGKLVTCLFSERGHDVKTPLRSGASDGDLERLISSVWRSRGDRYSEDRFEALRSIEGYASDGRRKIEMIRLGG